MTPGQGAEALVLVPNHTALQGQLASFSLDRSGSGAFAAPAIEVFSLWAGQLLETSLLLLGRRTPFAPSHHRIRRLWVEAIRADGRDDWQSGDIATLAREAMEADRLCEHWLLPEGLVPGRDWSDDSFCAWRRQVHAAMAREGWLNPAEQLRWLCGLIADTGGLPVPLPERIVLRGFVELTRLERRLLAALEGLGVQATLEVAAPESPPTVERMVFSEPGEEWRAAAAWARREVEAGARRVAVAVNDLASLGPELERTFLHTFHPEAALALTPVEAGTVHLHGGRPLLEHPLVADALELLELSLSGPRRGWPFARVSRWLRSRCWAGADEERAARALLELRMRRNRRYQWSFVDVTDAAKGLEVPLLVESVARLQDVGESSAPARRFHALLTHWGWPGPGAVGRIAQQAVDGLRQAFEEIEFTGVRDDGEALTMLRQWCGESRRPSMGGPLSPVQVLDIEDAAGQSFDATWVMNVHGDNWPAPVRTNRLLPFSMTRHLPRSRPDTQFAHGERVHDALLASARRLVFSRAAQVDGVPTAPSALVGEGAEPSEMSLPGAQLARATWPGAGDPETASGRDRLLPEPLSAAPALPADELELRGVVRLLNTQSACPWAAFLVHRLGAEFPDSPSAFADASYTGSLVHSALEQLYSAALAQGGLPDESGIEAAVAAALVEEHADRALAPAAESAERRRLEHLLRQWLAYERSQPLGRPWRLEEDREAQLAGFRFRVRMDRIDRIGDGALLLDYKTGKLAGATWGRERPVELQLPLYAVLSRTEPEPVLGIGQLGVHGGDMHRVLWTGEASLKGKGVKLMGDRAPFPDWPTALASWASTINGLLDEFRRGECGFVVHDEKALNYLGLDLLLRLAGSDEEEFAMESDHV